GGRVVRAIPETNTEGERRLNLIGERAQAALNLRQLEIGPDRGVAAGDIESHTHDRHLVSIRGHAANRHDIAHVPIGHQRRALRSARHIAQLLERVRLVRTENLNVSHWWKFSTLRPQAIQCPRERNRFTDVGDPANPRNRTFYTETEAGVHERPVLTQIQIPRIRLFRQSLGTNARQQLLVIVLALAAADDLAIALRRQT